MVCYDAISMACSISLKFCKMVKECFYEEKIKEYKKERKVRFTVIVCLIELAIVRENEEKRNEIRGGSLKRG